jgi:hypothetical protein
MRGKVFTVPHADQDLQGLRAIASGRGGVVSAADLTRCGVSARAAGRRVACGDWSRVGRAYVLAPRDLHLSDQAWCHILRLSYGERARISGHLALRHGGWSLPGDSRVIVMPHEPKFSITGVTVLRRPDDAAVRRPDGVRFTRVREALIDALVVVGAGAAEDLLDVTLQKRLITPEDFGRAAASRLGRGKRGASLLASLVERASTGTRSEAEQRMAGLLRRSGTGPWEPNLPVTDASGRVLAEIDFAHVGLRIAIEVDGRAHHSDRRSFERDRSRQNELVLRGWLVLRFTWEQITQRPDEVIAAVIAAVVQRAA